MASPTKPSVVAELVPLDTLLARPADWHGRLIRTQGFATVVGLSDDRALVHLFPRERGGPASGGDASTCTLLDPPILVLLQDTRSEKAELSVLGAVEARSAGAVEVEGVFDGNGHRLMSGTIGSDYPVAIKRASILETPAETCRVVTRLEGQAFQLEVAKAQPPLSSK